MTRFFTSSSASTASRRSDRRYRHGCGWRGGPAPPRDRNSASARSTTASWVRMRLQFAPQRDAFEQRAGAVHAAAGRATASHPYGNARSTKGGADQLAGGVDRRCPASAARCRARSRRSCRRCMAISMPVRPSGRVALRMRRSTIGAPVYCWPRHLQQGTRLRWNPLIRPRAPPLKAHGLLLKSAPGASSCHGRLRPPWEAKEAETPVEIKSR